MRINSWMNTKIKNYGKLSLPISNRTRVITNQFGNTFRSIFNRNYRYPYVFGETFCILRGFMAETSTNASVLIITAFTVERYIAICHPFLAHVISTLSRVKKIIFGIWIIASLLAVPQVK